MMVKPLLFEPIFLCLKTEKKTNRDQNGSKEQKEDNTEKDE